LLYLEFGEIDPPISSIRDLDLALSEQESRQAMGKVTRRIGGEQGRGDL
jgi:hypothetical protein